MKFFIKQTSYFIILLLLAGFMACGGGGSDGEDGGASNTGLTPEQLADNYSKIAVAYSNALSSATESSVDNTNLYHVVTTLKNSNGSVSLATEVCMNSDSVLQGVLGTYTFNNYICSNGVALNGTLEYYTIGADATVFVLNGTITASGTANGSYIYRVLCDNGTLSGYAGIAGYYYDYSAGATTSTLPVFSVPEKPVFTYYTPPTEGLEYTLINGGTEYSVSKGTAVTTGTVLLPEVWEGKKVTAIAANAFNGCTELTNLTIPENITSIGERAFSNCTGLTSLIVPDKVTSIDNYAFYLCSGLESMTMSSTISTIGYHAFEGCSSLTGLSIPASITSIELYAFKNCSGLKSLTILGTLSSIKEGLFYGCSGLTSLTIPDNATSIADYAFHGCSGLTTITIPANVASIGIGAFYNCSGLTNVTIPANVTSISALMFYGCTGLKNASILNNTITMIPEYFFQGCTLLESFTIPAGVTIIGSQAFSGCASLNSITIPETIYAVNVRAFEYCTGLMTVIVNPVTPPSVGYYYLGNYLFEGCTSLTAIRVPAGKVDDYKGAGGWNDFPDLIVSQ